MRAREGPARAGRCPRPGWGRVGRMHTRDAGSLHEERDAHATDDGCAIYFKI